MTRGVVQEQNLDKQMGCMAGFLQIFDRGQVISGKRLYSAKRLPPSTVMVDSVVDCEKVIGSPVVTRESEKNQYGRSAPSPDRLKQFPSATELRSPSPASAAEVKPAAATQAVSSPLPLPVFEFKEGTRSSWKFSREAPRLSLDSRATVDAKGSLYPREIRTNAAILNANRRCDSSDATGDDDSDKNRRSPSVIARLMGLEPIQQNQQFSDTDPEPAAKSELRRSASESRVSKDLYHYRFVDGNAFTAKPQSQVSVSGNVIRDNAVSNLRSAESKMFSKVEHSPKAQQNRGIAQRKSYFDAADFFPEPKQTVTPVYGYGEIEKRLRLRGIDEPSKDLETLKQILEALQLKGLLHPRKSTPQIDYRNFVYDNRTSFSLDESPIVVMRPARPPPPTVRSPRYGSESHPTPAIRPRQPAHRRNPNSAAETLPAVSPRLERGSRSQSPGRNAPSPAGRSESKSPGRRRALSIETPRRGNDVAEHRRVSPVSSPKFNSSRSQQAGNRSPRVKRSTAEIARKDTRVFPPVEDESSTVSESTSTDTERAKVEEYKEGRSLLERCDKLLHSIAEITAAELQPSPVSVLDSSFYKDDSSTSPIMKRSIDFKEQSIDLDEETWVTALSSPIESEISDGLSSEDCDLIYISEILRALNYFPVDSNVFQLLEKQRCLKQDEDSKVPKLQRRLIFDTITEILNRYRQLPPWKATNASTGQALLNRVWAEFRRIREREEAEDLFEVICGILRKDLNGDIVRGWGDCAVEVSEAVLDIERLIFKDLIGETIQDLSAFSSAKCLRASASCRKLVF